MELDYEKMKTGILYLLPTVLNDDPVENSLGVSNIKVIQRLRYFIVEELKTARRFLRKTGVTGDFTDYHFLLFNEHTDKKNIQHFIDPLLLGNDVGILSEAGLPCVADPGSEIVRLAHRHKIRTVPLTGPSSIFLALMASGFNGQNFTFHGYLPIEKSNRLKKIKELEDAAYSYDQTQLFIEAPYRNLQLFNAIITTCRPETMLCTATELTSENESILARTVKEWKNEVPDINKKPTVFLLYRQG
jgi:16S rRNA (cytidine1402-2'-O)-methyltransferase